MQSIPKMVFQTQLNEWHTIEKEIERSKIKRYPYKSLLGISLTKFIVQCMEEGLNSTQTFSNIINNEKIKIYLYENPLEVEDINKNIWISVCARYSESRSYIGKVLKV